MTSTLPALDLNLIARLAQRDAKSLTPEEAEEYLSWHFTDQEQARITELCERNQTGTITETERTELDHIVTLNGRLSLLHAKSRHRLKLLRSANP